MAVYKRTYKGYNGPLTPEWSRFLVLPKYSYARLFQSRFIILFYIACMVFPLGCALFIYLSHNLSFLKMFNIQAERIISINPTFFMYYCNFQAGMAYLMTAFIGPSLVSPDLVNNALPLYFCRPFSRAEYISGKMSVLLYTLSTITWVPGLILFGLQASLAGGEWTRANLWIAGSIFLGSMIWIIALSLIALAMSAWVRWKVIAGALILAVFVMGSGLGAAANSIMRTQYGALLDLAKVHYTILHTLFGLEPATGISTEEAWLAMGGACALCLWLLAKKVRAFEVVK